MDTMRIEGEKSDDWYRHKETGEIVWIEGNKEHKGYEHLGPHHTEKLSDDMWAFYNGTDQSRTLYYKGKAVSQEFFLPEVEISTSAGKTSLLRELQPVVIPGAPFPVPRAVIPDYISVGVSQSAKAFAGSGTSFGMILILRGKTPGLYFSSSIDGYIGAGVQGDISIFGKVGYYAGNRDAFDYTYLQGIELGGVGGIGNGENINIFGGYALPPGSIRDKIQNPGFWTGGVSVGGGVGAFGGVYSSYTPKLIPIFKK